MANAVSAATGEQLLFFSEVFGRRRIHWSSDHESIAAMADANEIAKADPAYRDVAIRIGETLMGGSTHETILRAT